MNLRVVPTVVIGNFVCPWCSEKFIKRSALLEHWVQNAQCARNRYVSSQTSDKHFVVGTLEHPGEETLKRIRSKNCQHSTTHSAYDLDQEYIGQQCDYCMTIFPSDDD